MERHDDPFLGASGDSARPSRIVQKLNGEACTHCGERHYSLVFRMRSTEPWATVAARCSGCQETREIHSLEQLTQDVDATPAAARAGRGIMA